MDVNLGLSKGDFDKLVIELQNGNEELFEIAFRRLVKSGIRKLRLKFRDNNNIIEDTVMETLIIFRERLIKGKVQYGAVDYLFYKILIQEHLRNKKKESKFIQVENNDSIGYLRNKEFNPFENERYYFLNIGFNKLSKVCRDILNKFYELNKLYIDNLNNINESEEINLNNVAFRKRKQRCLGKLKEILKKIEYLKY